MSAAPQTEDAYAIREWLAWRVVCRQLEERGIDVNAPSHDLLVRSLRHYAVMYHQLYPAGELHAQAEGDALAIAPLMRALR